MDKKGLFGISSADEQLMLIISVFIILVFSGLVIGGVQLVNSSSSFDAKEFRRGVVVQRIITSGNCFSLTDDSGRVLSTVWDLDKLNQEVFNSCVPFVLANDLAFGVEIDFVDESVDSLNFYSLNWESSIASNIQNYNIPIYVEGAGNALVSVYSKG